MLRASKNISKWLPTINRPLCGCTTRNVRKSSVRLSSTQTNQKKEIEAYYEDKVKKFGYSVLEVTDIGDYNATGVWLKHDQTGAEHLHIERDDQNNVFSVSFRTTPFDDTGVSHILEHTVLCGSDKYPVRDPFFKMLNRSLSTFMNAMTASDWTMYPFSTQNEKDYYNLMSVYLDAAFFPHINELDFRQEGWRLEHSDLTDPSSDIIFKGVVFNEMKGALSNSESLFHEYNQRTLLPDHTYGYCSGGDPLHIPHLTWEQLKDFHKMHYHPSNAKFYTYGNLPLEGHLEKITEGVLNHYQKIDPQTEIPLEPKWTSPKEVTVYCAYDQLVPDPHKQCMVAVSYMMDYSEDPFESFTLGLISALLVSGPNSPFYQALIESNIGSDYSPVLGLDTYTKHPTFSVGLQGLAEGDIDKVVEIIHQTFQDVYRDGFDAARIESLLHSIELGLKHQSSNFGLHLIMGLNSSWNQDKNPLRLLELNKQVERLQQVLATDESFLQNKIKTCFLDNTHRLTLTMKPQDGFNQKKDEKESELLQKKIKELTPADIEKLFEQGKILENLQNQDEDISVLPKMTLSDIKKNIIKTGVDHSFLDNVQLQTSEQPTNGVTYFRSIATTSSLPYVLKPFLPLFCNVLTKMGTTSHGYKDLAQQIELHTGGISASPHLVTDHSDMETFQQGILLSSHCLQRNIPPMFSLIGQIANQPTLNDPERLRTLVNSYANDLIMSVPQSGHMYAMAAAAKSLSPAAQQAELFSGLSQVQFMKQIAENLDCDDVIENLIKIAMYMLNANEMRCSINTTQELMQPSISSLQEMLNSMNIVGFNDDRSVEDDDFLPKTRRLLYEMDLPVHYVSRCVRTVPYTHPDTAKLQVLAKVLSSKYLHREIREKGGAYGSGAKIGGGIFSFFSYRDPNSVRTLEAFDHAVEWASQGKFKDEDIEEAKLSVFSSIDSPVSPGNRGMALFNNGLSDELRQTHRDRLFGASRDDLVDVCQRYLLPGKSVDSFAIVGPKTELSKDSHWKTVANVQIS